MAKNIHVTHRKDVVGAGDSRASSLHRTQGAAIEAARPIAQSNRSELVIHGRDNLIRAKDSYGHDSFLPRG
jgi:hypothetical protein